jgi:anti-anti-sigma factor
MFEITRSSDGAVRMTGRLDAAKAPRAQEFLDRIEGPCVIDLGELEYISSAGLGVLLRTHKRLMGSSEGLRLVNVNSHINDIFTYSGFDRLFDIQAIPITE